jgi:hypothetical protein
MEDPIIDPNYEFEAPQFVNFSDVLDAEDDHADAWFGKFKILYVTEKCFIAAIGDLTLNF